VIQRRPSAPCASAIVFERLGTVAQIEADADQQDLVGESVTGYLVAQLRERLTQRTDGHRRSPRRAPAGFPLSSSRGRYPQFA